MTKTPKKAHPLDPALVSKAQAEKIYEVILDLKEAGHLAKRQLNLELLTSTLVERFSIDSTDYATDLISARAKAVLDLMDEAKTAHFDWSRKAIYRELKSASKRKKDADSMVLTPLRIRRDDDESDEEEEDGDDSSLDESEHEDPRARRGHQVRKSVLRPKSSSVATKQIGKRTRSAAAAADGDDDDNEDDSNDEKKSTFNDYNETEHDQLDDFETPSKRGGGHELVRDPLSTRAKRARSLLSGSSTPVGIHRKIPLRRALHKNPSMSASASASVSASGDRATDSADSDAVTTTTDDKNHDSADAVDTITDTWTCQAQDCDTVIEKSSTKRSQTLIQKHRDEHAGITQEKLDVVFAEKELNTGLPVDNLLSRIRELGTGFSDILGSNEVG